jgi:hypothetical protein
MERFRRFIKWLLIGAATLVLLVATAALVYVRSEHFTRWLREEAVAVVNQQIRGSIEVERLEGSVWRDVILHNVVLRYEDAEILSIPRLEVAFSLWRLIWGELQISQIDALKPWASLNQDREGRWNVVEALGPREPKPEQSSEFSTLVRSLSLRDGGIDLRLNGKEEKLYRLENLNLEGGVGVLPDGVSLEVRELLTKLVAKGLPELQLKGALGYQQRAAGPPTLNIKNLWAVSRDSRVKLGGEIVQRETTQINAQASIEKLAPADIAYFVPDWPLKRDLAGSVAIAGSLDDLAGNVSLAGDGAKLAGKFRADAAQDPLRYSATINVSGFDLRQWLGRKDMAGVVSGALEARGSGFGLQSTVAKAQLEVRGAEAQGWTLGTLATEAKLENSLAVLQGRLEGNMGAANWSGKVGLKDKRPTYDLALAVKDLVIEKTVPNADNIKGKLNLQGTVKGAGITLADMNTRAEIRILPSSVGAVNLQNGQIDATLRDRKVFVSRAAFNAADSVLTVNGELGLDAKTAGNLDYRFRAADVAPWLSLFQQKGSGSVELAGQARGTAADLQTQGTVRFSALKLNAAAVRNGDLKFAVRGSAEQVFPQGVVTFRLAGVDAGVALRRLDGQATLTRAPAQAIQLEVNAQDNAERKHAFNGTVNFLSDAVSLRLNQVTLAAPDGLWKLARPATLSKKDQVFVVEQVSMRNGDREISVQGRLSLAGSQDLRLNVDRLPVETLLGFMAEPPKL